MASLMENLIEVLGQECTLYESLMQVSMKKTPTIVAGDIDALQKITDEEQEIVGRILNLDRKRQEVTKDMANVLNKDVETLKLTTLIQMLEKRPEEQKALADVFDRLQDVTAQVARVNEQNRQLLEGAMEMVQFNLNLMQSMRSAPETANYNKGAYSDGSLIGTSASGFDAKQ